MKVNTIEIGKRIAALRENHSPKLDQHELASIMGVTQQRIDRMEQGGKPSLENIVLLSVFFGVTTDYIITGKTDNSPEIEKIKFFVQELSKAVKKI
jgi:transcriptional regulator with XRE-family HTH domain